MFLYLLANLAAADQPAIATPAVKDVRQLFAVGDYPADAVRKHWEGSAVADLTVDTNGRVSECRIVESSGHKVLDDATCNILSRRAYFIPPLDAQGQPVRSSFRAPPIRWRLYQ